MNILIIDDDVISLTILHIMIERVIDCNVETFNDVYEAEAAYKKTEYDFMFVDNHMPYKGGLEFIADYISYSTYYKKKLAKIIMCSANISDDSSGDFISVLKPVKLEDLKRILK